MTQIKTFTIDELANGEIICYVDGKINDYAESILYKFIKNRILDKRGEITYCPDVIYRADERLKNYIINFDTFEKFFTEEELSVIEWFTSSNANPIDDKDKEEYVILRKELDDLDIELFEKAIPQYKEIERQINEITDRELFREMFPKYRKIKDYYEDIKEKRIQKKNRSLKLVKIIEDKNE